MRRRVTITVSGTLTMFAVVLGATIFSNALADEKDTPTPIYNPYPPGILPSDLDESGGARPATVRWLWLR